MTDKIKEVQEKALAEIANRIHAISAEQTIISRKGNDLWEEKNELRAVYKRLSGKDIL